MSVHVVNLYSTATTQNYYGADSVLSLPQLLLRKKSRKEFTKGTTLLTTRGVLTHRCHNHDSLSDVRRLRPTDHLAAMPANYSQKKETQNPQAFAIQVSCL
jgi:hypothetical protein